MLKVESVHNANAEALAIDALFKRLAKRGRRIRLQSQATGIASLNNQTLTEEEKDFCSPPLGDSENSDMRPVR